MSAPVPVSPRHARARSTARNVRESRSRSSSIDSVSTLNMNNDFSMVQRWNGRTREATDWNSLRRDPEIFFPQGNCLVYLFDRGSSRRGPSFRIPYDFLLYSSCRPLIEQALMSSLQTSLYHPGSTTPPSYENLHDPSSYETTYCSLYLDAPAGLSRLERFNYHVTSRNFFAWLVGAPLVGPDPISALLDLKVRMDMWRDPGADNFGALYNYVKEQEYGDFEDLEIQMGKRLEGHAAESRPQPYRNLSHTLEEDEEAHRGRRSSMASLKHAVRGASQTIIRRLSRSRAPREESHADEAARAAVSVTGDDRGRPTQARGRDADRGSIVSRARRRLSGTRSSSVTDARPDDALLPTRTPRPGQMWTPDVPTSESVAEPPPRHESRTRRPSAVSRNSLTMHASGMTLSAQASRTDVSADQNGTTAMTVTHAPRESPVVSPTDTSAHESDSIFRRAKRRLSRTRAPTSESAMEVPPDMSTPEPAPATPTSPADIAAAPNATPVSATPIASVTKDTESMLQRGRRRISRSRKSSIAASESQTAGPAPVAPSTPDTTPPASAVPADIASEAGPKRERRVSWAAAPSTSASANASQTNLASPSALAPKPAPPILKTRNLPTTHSIDQPAVAELQASPVIASSSKRPGEPTPARHSASSSKASNADHGICDCCGRPKKPRAGTPGPSPTHATTVEKKTAKASSYHEICVPDYGNGLEERTGKRDSQVYTMPGQPPTTGLHSEKASTSTHGSSSSVSDPLSTVSTVPYLDYTTQSPSTASWATGSRSRDASVDGPGARRVSIVHGVDMSDLEVGSSLDALIRELSTDDLSSDTKKGKAPVRSTGYMGMTYSDSRRPDSAEAPDVLRS